MEKKVINPWNWQDQRSYVQAIEVKNHESVLYISGQTAVNFEGKSSSADMKTQLIEAISNLEEVLKKANYLPKHIVRLNIYTTSQDELWPHFSIIQNWITNHNIQTTLTFLEVTKLFETLSVELEVTAIK